MIDILIVLNNFIHDLSAAAWFCGTLTMLFIAAEAKRSGSSGMRDFVQRLFARIKLLTHSSLAIVLLGGIVRAFAYQQYEWMPALGRGQVTLLIIKHVLLTVIVIAGIYLQIRLSRKVRQLP
ncbi:MAG: hypothetical protein C0618_03665 [Desulfuromonas sp.]|nr:MAG: hypothetical protein C0618_03665 [Desulfuromonas sp.]